MVFAKFDYTDVTRANVLETKNSNEIQEQFFYEKVSCVILTDSASHQRCLQNELVICHNGNTALQTSSIILPWFSSCSDIFIYFHNHNPDHNFETKTKYLYWNHSPGWKSIASCWDSLSQQLLLTSLTNSLQHQVDKSLSTKIIIKVCLFFSDGYLEGVNWINDEEFTVSVRAGSFASMEVKFCSAITHHCGEVNLRKFNIRV